MLHCFSLLFRKQQLETIAREENPRVPKIYSDQGWRRPFTKGKIVTPTLPLLINFTKGSSQRRLSFKKLAGLKLG